MINSKGRKMDASDIESKPKAGAGDVAHTLIRTGLSAIPVLGGPAAEIFSAIIVPPLSKRRDEWIESIAKKLKALEEKVDDFNIEALSQNEVFVTTVMHASQVAIRNHQKEKLEALRNAVLNAALSNAPEEDIQLMFLNFVDTFTPWHLRILKFFDNPQEWGRRVGITYPNWPTGSLSTVLEHTFPELRGRRDFYDQVVKDLFIRGLMNTESLHGIMTPQGMFASRTTPLGKQFINFITSPIESDDD
ncbi:MAG: hypothetical protein SCAL_000574 [Candidatus Syntrophoarchaeum caldarius]|uniref:Uncharacterized protein n=1 Tax=Candidatus Syntropharchaeum caldarium TaxID=1838285 RepID=A0A1F2PA32_9EURY|nr:MAG: hypothetical protein SCAL_000574 [Candidatus Syntrophoarchaeum caldarius]